MRATRKITISMPADMAKEVKRLAKRENISMSGLFRDAFRRHVLVLARTRDHQINFGTV